jgi:putative transposase
MEFPVSSYYYAKKRQVEPSAREVSDSVLKVKIMEVWSSGKGRKVLGARKVWLPMNSDGIPVARYTVERLMRELGIRGAGNRRKRPPTTLPGDPAERPSDLLDRNFHAAAPNRRWVADIMRKFYFPRVRYPARPGFDDPVTAVSHHVVRFPAK